MYTHSRIFKTETNWVQWINSQVIILYVILKLYNGRFYCIQNKNLAVRGCRLLCKLERGEK